MDMIVAEGGVELISKESLGILMFLLPGLVAAWVFYGLTAHPRRETTERVIQALIFTAFVQCIVYVIRAIVFLIGYYLFSLGPWTDTSTVVVPVLVALGLGLLFSWAANTNFIHSKLDKVTKKTSYPSQWYSVFNQYQRYIVLNMKDGGRLWGWPEEWPDECDNGHFVLFKPAWVMKDGKHVPLHHLERMLVPTSEVSMVEFEKPESELHTISSGTFEKDYGPLIQLHKETDDGKAAVKSDTGKSAA